MPTSRDITITRNGMRLSLSVRLTVSLAISIVLVASAAACADKASSGVAGGKPCAAVAKYCNVPMFAATLAKNCPKSCGKCGTVGESRNTTRVMIALPLFPILRNDGYARTRTPFELVSPHNTCHVQSRA